MRSDLILSLQKLIRDELALLGRLGHARRDASRRMPTLVRTGLKLHNEARALRDVEPVEAT